VKKRYTKLIYFFLLILILCITVHELPGSFQLENQTPPIEKTGPGSKKWSELLRAFEKHTEESKLFIEKIANSKECSMEKKLAALLLLEWDLNPESKFLKVPRIVYQEPYRYEKNRVVKGGTVYAKIETDSIGNLLNVDFIKIMDDAYVKDMILESLNKSCYRPPFINGKFTAGSGHIIIHIDVM
jgi:hypothetical protein